MHQLGARRLILWSLAGSVYGVAIGAWLQGLDQVLLGAAVGLAVGALCGATDTLFDRAIAWTARRTHSRIMTGIAGTVVGTSITLGMTLLILGAVGWIGSCWG